jgi:hypothetical protein
MSAPTVTIAGVNVAFEGGQDGSGSVALDWSLVSGFQAPIQGWELPSDKVAAIVTQYRGQEVEINLGGTRIKRVIVLGNAASHSPVTQILLLTDVRWYWRTWTAKAANVRRRIGARVLVGNVDVQAQGVVDTIRYAPWSLKDGSKAYTWKTLATEVLDGACSADDGHPAISYVFDPGTLGIDDLLVQEEFIDDGTGTAIARAVGALPGRSLYIDLDGLVHVFDACPGAEDVKLSGLPPAVGPNGTQWGSLRKIDNSAVRSKTYRVLFDPELEVLLFALNSVFTHDNPNLPWMENVLRVTDKTLAIPAVSGYPARTVGEGTYITITEACAAWGSAPNNGQKAFAGVTNAAGALTIDAVRNYFLYPDWFWTQYVVLGTTSIDPIWAARIEELVSSFRTRFRVNYQFWKRVRSVRPYRAGIWDTATGTRADSPVYCDFARQPTVRSDRANRTNSGYNVTCWNAQISQCQRAQAHVVVEDEDQGVFRIVWQNDFRRLFGDLAPSGVVQTPDVDTQNRLSYQGMFHATPLVSEASFQLATIVSCVPAAPNDARRLYAVDVTLEDALSFLNAQVDSANKVAYGQPQAFRSRLPITSARFSYPGTSTHADDAAAIPTLAVFGAVAQPTAVNVLGMNVQTILVPQNQDDELVPMARSIASAVVVSQLDHWEGEREVQRDDSLVPLGSIESVTHRCTAKSVTTIVRAHLQPLDIDVISRLPASARKVIAREAQP